jgi:hypothetical protein
VNPVALRGIFNDEDKKRKKWRIHRAASAGADANETKELRLHSPVCAGCEQFAFKGFPPVTPLARSWRGWFARR